MTAKQKPTYEELKQRLSDAEELLNALRSGKVNTIFGKDETLIVKLAEVEKQQAHIKQVLLGIRNVNQLITQEHDPKVLLEKACVNLTETLGYNSACIVLLNTPYAFDSPFEQDFFTEEKFLEIASSGFNNEFAQLQKQLHENNFTTCMQQALRNGELIVVKNLVSCCPECPVVPKCGVQAAFCKRLGINDKVYGVLVVSVPIDFADSEEEQDLFNELVGDLAFALDRIEKEKILERSRRRYQHFFEGSRDGFVFVDSEGKFIHANDAYCEMLGYTLKELQALPDFYSITPERWHQWESEEIVNKRLLQEGYSGLYEKEYIHKDGHVFPVELQSYAHHSPEGKIEFLWGVARDITAKQKAENQRKQFVKQLEYEKRLQQLLFEASTKVLEVDDFAATARHIFDAACELIGAKSGYVALLNETGDENEVLFLEAGGMPCTVDESLPMPIRGLRSEAYRTQQAVYDNDFMNHDEWASFLPEGHVALQNVMFAPLNVQGKTVGIMGLANKPEDFSENDAHIAEAFGQLAAIALQNSRNLGALQESESKWRGILVNVPQVGIALDPNATVIFVNDHFLKVTGWREAEVLGKNWFDTFIPEDIREEIRDVFYQDMVSEKTTHLSSYQNEIVTRTGERHTIAWSNVVTRNVDGSIADVTCLGIDLTEREVAEAALRESEERFRLLLENAPMYIMLAEDGKYTYGNPASARLLGFDNPECFVGTNILDTIAPDFHPVIKERLQNIGSGQGNKSIEIQLLQSDGTRIWVRSASVPMIVNNKPVAIIMGQNIEEQKQAEKEQEKLQVQLSQAQKMESVGRLAGGVAHDFNNMLNVILGNAEFVMEGLPKDDTLRESITEIQDAARRSADLTRQLLAFARKQTVTPKVLDLNETIASMIKMLHRLVNENITVVWKPVEKIKPIKIDPTQIDQMLANLVVNARDAIGTKAGRITIATGSGKVDEDFCEAYPELIPGDYVTFSVSDNGCGMDEITRRQIFEPFFTTKGVGEGTGLGLSTVYGVVRQNNGIVNVYSEPGKGTTFRIYLPVYEAEGDNTSREKSVNKVLESGHETILLVEDEPAILKMTTKMLTRMGYEVIAAVTPGEAIALAEAHAGAIDMLFTDVVMPEMNGRDLAKRVLSLYPDMKRLFMSGYTADVIAHHGIVDEGMEFIQKPFSKKELEQKIRKVLDA